MNTMILGSALCCLLAPIAELHAGSDPSSETPGSLRDLTRLTLHPDSMESDERLYRGVSLGAFQDEGGAQAAEPPTSPAPPSQGLDDIWTRDRILGDWWGVRTDLEQHGVTLELKLTQYYQAVVSGGSNTTGKYGGQMEYVLTFDSEKLGLWPGFFFSLHTRTQFGDLLLGEAGAFVFPNTQMLWPLPDYDGTAITGALGLQFLSKNVAVGGGKIDVLDLYTMIMPNVGGGTEGFMNMNVLAPASPFLRYVPLTTLGGGMLVLNDKEEIQGGLLAFDPNNSSTTIGVTDAFSNGVGILGLWRFFFEVDDKPASILFLGAGSTGEYDNLDPIPAEPSYPPVPNLLRQPKGGVWTAAFIYQMVVWQNAKDSKRKLDFITGWAVSDGDPSFGKFAGFGSLEAYGILFDRENDRAGVGAFYSQYSRDLKDDLGLFGFDVADVWGVEVYYNAEVTPWLHVTGDLQVVQSVNQADDPAVILGVRAVLDF